MKENPSYLFENLSDDVLNKESPTGFFDTESSHLQLQLLSEYVREEFAEHLKQKIDRQDYLFYGTWFPGDIDLSNRRFNNWADFRWVTFNDKASFKDSKFLANCQFICATFKQDVSFRDCLFDANPKQKLPTSFHDVTFESVADFNSARFKVRTDFTEAKLLLGDSDLLTDFTQFALSSFSYATFEDEVSFEKCTFGQFGNPERYDSFFFTEATFEKFASFRFADFVAQVGFNKAIFKKTADFRNTRVKTSLSFAGTSFEGFAKFSGKDNKHNSWPSGGLNFTSVDVEKAEKISFQTLNLKPDSFIRTDVRKFEFVDIKWKIKRFAFDWSRSKDILFWRERARRRESDYEHLEVVYRRLAANAEDNARYRYASKFRFTAFDIQRINRWYGRLPITLLWWYKWTSRYGESWGWATAVLLVVLTISAYAYTIIPFLYALSTNQLHRVARAVSVPSEIWEGLSPGVTVSLRQHSKTLIIADPLQLAAKQ